MNRVVIVDDEQLAREGLRDAIERAEIPSLEIAASCENGVTALEVIRRLEPEILLLDIVMPVLDGFAMLEQLEPEATPPAVVIVTAHDEYAVRAFDAEATDFLVKPASDERVRAALDRAVRRVAESRALRAGLEQPPTMIESRQADHLVIPDRGRMLIVPIDEIDWIEGDTYYVRVHTRGRVRLLRERLAKLEALLDAARFHRTHRSALVKVELIREVRAESPYSYSALLSTGDRVPVSRERVKSLRSRLAHS
jgi:two-component system LytT family response regulator